MKWMQILLRHEWRHAVQAGLAVALSILVGNLVDPVNVVWMVLSVLVVIQTSRGTPAHQGFYSLFVVMVAVIGGFIFSEYITQREFFLITMTAILVGASLMAMFSHTENYQMLLLWLLPPLVLIAAALWPAGDEMMLTHRLLMVAGGGVIGIFSSLLVLPVMPYWEFSMGLVPILNALIQYAEELEKYLLSERGSGKLLQNKLISVESLLCSQREEYPEWVFEPGFNRDLRSSFRYVLVQLDRITETVISLNYHVRQSMDAELFAEVAPKLAEVSARNAELLQILRAFFAGEKIEPNQHNFTSDITNVYQSLRNVLPASVELLDVSSDYANVAALARDVIDMRELLLQILTGLPLDEKAELE